MKKTLFMKMIPLLLGILFQVTNVWGQLLVENFDYVIGTNITSNGWTAHSSGGSQPITVTNGLIFPGYLGSDIGGAALLDNTGEDAHKTFAQQSTGVVYTAFMVNVTTTSAGYFFHLGGSPIGTTFRGKVFLDATNHFGVSVGSNTATSSATTYVLGQTYFLVLKYEIVSGTNNDKVSLFVFDGTFPTAEPATPTIGPLTDAAMTDINPACVALRQYSATQNITVDGIRIAANWLDAATPSGGPATVATPTFSPPPGNVLSPLSLTILCSTPDAEIHYTTDGQDPNQGSPIFYNPIDINQTTTVKAIAYATGYEPSAIATGVYTFPANVSTVAELRAGIPGTVYKLTGEVVLTYQQAWRNQKFVQDATAGIVIDDLNGIIISDYEIGDGITGMVGTIANFNTMLQFTPVTDPGDPTSAGNIITPVVVTINELFTNFENYESELVTIHNATFENGGVNFASGTVYPITDVSDATGNFRTSFFDADYLSTAIPVGPCNLTGIPNAYVNQNYFTSRFASDIVPQIITPTIIITSPNGFEYWEQGSTHNITWGNINFTGNVKISLIKGFLTTVLAADVPNTGSWSWTIPTNQSLSSNYKIKVQGINIGEPSDVSDDFFTITGPLPDPVIVINEIMYNPSNSNPFMSDDYYEYLELYNNSGFNVNLDNWYFSQGITHTFPVGTTIPDGGYLVVAINADTIMHHYGITNVVKWTSGNLGNSGEIIELKDPDGITMDMVSYLDVAPWPTSPDGTGPSLELLDVDLDNSLAENWAASVATHGSPGVQNSVAGLEILTLTAPNGGEVFVQGSSQSVTWTHTNFSGLIRIELITATDSREILAENIPVTDLLWDWEIPGNQAIGTNYKIKISDMVDGTPMDESNAVFSIVATVVPTITVTSPNGGESWEQGASHNITWTTLDFTGNVKIELSNGTTTVQLANSIAATAGTWLWSIPVDQAIGSNYTISVTGMNTGDPGDASDAPFSIIAPIGIPNIVINEIMYNSIEALDNEWIELYNMEAVSIDLTGYVIKDNSNTHIVTFPAGHVIAPGQYFTVAIKINTPPLFFTPDWNANAGWGLDNGTDQVRLYNAAGAIVDSVQYSDSAPWPTSPDGSGPSLELIDPLLDNTLPASWLGSLATNGTPKAQNSVYLYEAITLTSPNGGEIFEQGSTHAITWTHAGFTGDIRIELITAADGREVLAENVSVALGTWTWVIPQNQPVGSNFKIKISDMIDGSPMDESNAVFSIASLIVPSIRVISPNGGEAWIQGTDHNIEWSATNFTNMVKIELSDGLGGLTLLADLISATGSPFLWTVPADLAVGSNYTVIISGINAGDPGDVSDLPFSIVAPPQLPALVINEIMYNTPGSDNEWIEIYNNGTTTINLEGYYIQDNNDLSTKVTFPAGYSIVPGQYFTVSLELLAPPLPFTPDFVGNPQPSWSLGNTSDAVRIFNPAGTLVDIVTYFDTAPWPTTPDGGGPTLSLIDPNFDNNVGESWAASPVNGGTPGSENFPPISTLTVISPNGGESVTQGTNFSISWSFQNFTGDVKIELVATGTGAAEVLFASVPVTNATADWNVTQAIGADYKIRISDASDGIPVDESDQVFSIIAPAGPPQIVINEIMFNPPETGTDTLEFIELYNNDNIPVDLGGWSFTQGVEFVFPPYILSPGEYLVVAGNAGAIHNTFGVTALQWTAGGLSNSGETIQLSDGVGLVIDLVTFDDVAPWPVAPDEYGPSLALTSPALDNSLAENWKPETKLALEIPNVYNIFASPGTVNFPAPAQSYLIAAGWSGISSYTAAGNTHVSSLMNLVVNDLIVMQDFSKLYFPLYGINTIDVWTNNTGYQLKMNKARYHVIWGPKISGSQILLSTGWNSISVLSECPVSAADLFGSLSNIIFVKEMGSDKIYWPDGSIFTLDFLMPGNAYYVKASAETTISFPACTAKSNYTEWVEKKSNPTIWNDVVNTASSHTIGFTASALSMLQRGDVIGAFNAEGYCAGMVTIGESNAALMAWGDDAYTPSKDGMIENEPIHFKVFRPSTGAQFEVVAGFDPSFTDGGMFVNNGISMVTSLKEGSIGITEANKEDARLYPNPASDHLMVVSGTMYDKVEIYSALGQMVYSGKLPEEQSNLNIQFLQKGYYVVKLMNSNNGIQKTLSFVKE